MDNATIFKAYTIGNGEGRSDKEIAEFLQTKGFDGGVKKLRQVVSGYKRKIKSVSKQIDKADQSGKADGEVPKYVRGLVRELFSGITWEQYPKIVAGLESMEIPVVQEDPPTYQEALNRITLEMEDFAEDSPATAMVANITGSFVGGYAELKALNKFNLIPKWLAPKSGQPLRNIGRSSLLAGTTGIPSTIASVKGLEDRGVYPKRSDNETVLGSPRFQIPIGAGFALGPAGDALISGGKKGLDWGSMKVGNWLDARKHRQDMNNLPPPPPSGKIADKSGPERSALSEISDRLERDVGGSLEPVQESMSEAGRLGYDDKMVLADKLMTGPQTRDLAGRYSRTPSQTASESRAFSEERITGEGANPLRPTQQNRFFQGPGMGERMGNMIQDLMGIRQNPNEFLAKLKKNRQREAPKHYDKAYTKYVTDDMGNQVKVGSQYIDVTPNMVDLFKRPTMQSAFKQAKKDALDDGFVLPDNLLELEKMTVQQFDYLQRGIKNVGQVGQRSNTMSDDAVRRVTSIRQALLDDVDDQLRAINPAGLSPYAQARSYWHDEMDYDRAYQKGIKWGSSNVKADDVTFEFKNMSNAEKEAVKLGMVSGFMNKIDNKMPTLEGYSIPQPGQFASPNSRKILEAVFPDGEPISDFITRMRMEMDIGATHNKIFQGSQTSSNEQEFRVGQKILPEVASNVGGNNPSVLANLRRQMTNMGLGELGQKRMVQEAESGGKKLWTPNPAEQKKVLEEVDLIRRENQRLMKQGLLTQGGLPSALTSIYPMSLLD